MRRTNGIFAVYIEKMEEGICGGCFGSLCTKGYVEFSDLTDMILKINQILQTDRDPGPDRAEEDFLFDLTLSKPSSRFYMIEVLYTEHASWQGRLSGTGCPRVCFKSVLELLEIMDRSIKYARSTKIAGRNG